MTGAGASWLGAAPVFFFLLQPSDRRYSFVANSSFAQGSWLVAVNDSDCGCSLSVNCVPPTITSTNLGNLQVGVPFVFSPIYTGSTPDSYSVSAGTLPVGIGLDLVTGTLSGTPTVAGAYSFSITALNDCGSATKAFSDTVLGASTLDVPPTIGSYTPTTGPIGIAFAANVTATGSPTPTFVPVGALSGWMTLNATTGQITGTPPAAGPYTVTIRATNVAGVADTTPTFSFVAAAVAPTIGPYSPIVICTGSALTSTTTATGTPAPTFAVVGSLESWMTLNPTTGTITGTPPGGSFGVFPKVIRATNIAGFADRNVSFTVNQIPTMTAYSVSAGTVGVPFDQPANGVTGVPAPTFAVTAGTLPAGVTLNASTGALVGTPTVSGAYSFTVTATNSCGSASGVVTAGNISSNLSQRIFHGNLPGTAENDAAISGMSFTDQPTFNGSFVCGTVSGSPEYSYIAIPTSMGLPNQFLLAPAMFPVPLAGSPTYTLGPANASHRTGTINGIAYRIFRSYNASLGVATIAVS